MLKTFSSNKVFEGFITKYEFTSKTLGGLTTQFNLFLPSTTTTTGSTTQFPYLVYLAGLTCDPDTAPFKSGLLRQCALHNLAVVFPDTSPRGAGIEGEETDWDFGTGAGFYLDATTSAYSKHYNMASMIVDELPKMLTQANLPLDHSRVSILGHSMGGHGALVLYLKNQGVYRSCSAFAPITNPILAPWGINAFNGYLAGGVEEGRNHDATELIAATKEKEVNILIDVGTADQFYNAKQLLPENFVMAAKKAGFGEDQVRVNYREGYDHSYYFISTFMEDHVKYHAQFLQ